jgi:hypothetical protein
VEKNKKQNKNDVVEKNKKQNKNGVQARFDDSVQN